MNDSTGGVQSAVLLGGTNAQGLEVLRAVRIRPPGRVLLAGRDEPSLETAAASLESGLSVTTLRYDALGGPESHEELADSATRELGEIDLVVAAAEPLDDREAPGSDSDEVVRILRSNLTGVASALIPLSERLAEQGHGVLVVLPAVGDTHPGRAVPYGDSAYAACEAGIGAFAVGLGESLAGSGVRVIVVKERRVGRRIGSARQPSLASGTPKGVGRAVARELSLPTRPRPQILYVPSFTSSLKRCLRLGDTYW